MYTPTADGCGAWYCAGRGGSSQQARQENLCGDEEHGHVQQDAEGTLVCAYYLAGLGSCRIRT